MNLPSDIDFNRVWNCAREAFTLGGQSLHGPAHWRRVEKAGIWIAGRTGADVEVVRLFAILHDTHRWDEGTDPDHGRRAAVFAGLLNGRLFHLREERLALLAEAIALHADGQVSDDPTIGTCWDADRLDLPRVGVWPSDRLLSTEAARILLREMEGSRPDGRHRL